MVQVVTVRAMQGTMTPELVSGDCLTIVGPLASYLWLIHIIYSTYCLVVADNTWGTHRV